MSQQFIRREQRQRVIKFLLCMTLGLLVAKLIGNPYTPTVAVSAILMLYIDRGYIGSLRYSAKRTLTQALMGGIACLFVCLFKWTLPLEDYLIGIFACCITVCIGFFLEYRFHFAPLTVTMGNAILIMVTGILISYSFYLERVLACLLGWGIAYFVNFICMPRPSRIKETGQQITYETLRLLADHPPALEAEGPLLGLIEKNLDLLREDARVRHLNIAVDDLALLARRHQLLLTLISARRTIQARLPETPEIFQQAYGEIWSQLRNVHSQLLTGRPPEQPLPAISLDGARLPRTDSQVHLLNSLLLYREELEQLIALHRSAQGSSPAQYLSSNPQIE